MGDRGVNATELLSRLTARGIRLRTVAGEIQVNRPGDILPDEREQLRRLKPELVELLAIRGREQPGDVLDLAERQRLMDDCADECRRSYTGQAIDWQAVDRINREIGETFDRQELTTLLGQYTAAILTGGPAA